MSWWRSILNWFSERKERQQIVENFNRSAKESFIMNEVPMLLRASITLGNSNFRHQFSWMFSGFRIGVVSGRRLTDNEIIQIGSTIASNYQLVRTLVANGFDTLEVTNMNGTLIQNWRLSSLLELGR